MQNQTDSSVTKLNIFRERNLHIIFSITTIGIMGVSSITPAFPKISQELGIKPEQVAMLITFFTFPGVILTPILGVLADRLGRKKILVPSLLLFSIAGTACFFIRNFHFLIIMRFFQGMGAAALGSLNITLIGDLYAGKQRNAAMGFNSSVLSIGTASFPLIGGTLATIAWYMPFILPVAAFPVGIGVLFFLKNPEPKNDQHLWDYLKEAWKNLKNVQIIGLFVFSALTFIILYGVFLTYFPFLLNHTFNASPFIIGLILSSASVSTALVSSQVGRLSHKYSEKTLMLFGVSLYILAIGSVPFMPTMWTLIIPGLLFGAGNGVNFPSTQALMTSLAPMNQRAVILSLNGTVLRLGQTLGPLLMATVYALTCLDGVFYAGSIVAVLMMFLVVFTIKTNEG